MVETNLDRPFIKVTWSKMKGTDWREREQVGKVEKRFSWFKQD